MQVTKCCRCHCGHEQNYSVAEGALASSALSAESGLL